jgi:hypothetical protein
LVFIQHLNHYFVDRVLITNNHTLNILPYHKNQSGKYNKNKTNN